MTDSAEVLSPKAILRAMEAFSTPSLDEKLLNNLQLTLHVLCPKVFLAHRPSTNAARSCNLQHTPTSKIDVAPWLEAKCSKKSAQKLTSWISMQLSQKQMLGAASLIRFAKFGW